MADFTQVGPYVLHNDGKITDTDHQVVISVDLQHCQIGNDGAIALAQALEQNTTLTSIDLPKNEIGNDGVIAIAKALKLNTTLTSIKLSSNDIGYESAIALAQALENNTVLTLVDLSKNEIGDDGVIAIASTLEKNSTLVSMDFSKNRIGRQGAKAIAETLEKNTTLTSINLSLNSIGYQGVMALAQALENNSTLTSIDLSKNDLSDDSAIAIVCALQNNKTLTSIDLEGNVIGRQGIIVLAQALENNSTLTSISLSENDIDDSSAKAIAVALKVNNTLTSIDLEGNSIGNQGAIAFAQALTSNRTLTSISLYWNKIGDQGAIAIAKALEKNTALISIHLEGNDIGHQGAIAFAHALKTNNTLTSMDLSDNSIGGDGIIAIASALEKNVTMISIDLNKYGKPDIDSKLEVATKAIKQMLKCNRGIRDILERRDMDTKEAVINGKELEVLQQTYDQTPSSLSKYYLGVLLEAGHDDQSSDKTKSFLKILGGLLPYNLQKLPKRFQRNLMEVIERKLLILYWTLTKASSWDPIQEDNLITYLSYMSILRTAHKESYGDLSMLISHCLQLKGLVSDEGYLEGFDPSLSFPEWLGAMNGLEAGNQIKVALYEILVKTACSQMQHGMAANNVLAAFTDFNRTQEIKQQIQQLIITEQQSQAASTIQRAWLSYQQKQNTETSVDSHGGLEHRHEPNRPKRKREQGFFMASSKKPCVQEEDGSSYQNK